MFAIRGKGGPLTWLDSSLDVIRLREGKEEPRVASGVSERNRSCVPDSVQEILQEQGRILLCTWPGQDERELRARADAFWRGNEALLPLGLPAVRVKGWERAGERKGGEEGNNNAGFAILDLAVFVWFNSVHLPELCTGGARLHGFPACTEFLLGSWQTSATSSQLVPLPPLPN